MPHGQLQRELYPLPRLVREDRNSDDAVTGKYVPEWLEHVMPAGFMFEGDPYHATPLAPMAV